MKIEPLFVDELQRGQCRKHLRRGSEPEERLRGDRHTRLGAGHAERREVNDLPVLHHHDRGSGNRAIFHQRLNRGVEGREIGASKPCSEENREEQAGNMSHVPFDRSKSASVARRVGGLPAGGGRNNDTTP